MEVWKVFVLSKEEIYRQLAFTDVAKSYEEMPKTINYKRVEGSKTWSQLSLLAGQTNKTPQQLIDWLIEYAFLAFFERKDDDARTG
jgi:hypothetical protein